MTDKYKDVCPNCELPKNTINDYFCIKNTGKCEKCLEKIASLKSQWYYKKLSTSK